MKLLLVTVSFEDVQRSKIIQYNSHYPLGLAYLHSYLEEYWHDVKTLFLNDYSYEDCSRIFKDTILEFKPEYVGFNILSNNRVLSFELIKWLEKEFPKIKIVVGGIHASVMYEQILNNISSKVICVLGEGEETLKEILDGRELSDIKGIAYKEDDNVIKTQQRDFLCLDTIPKPKHSYFNYQNSRTLGALLTSRGCPFNCSFCVLESVSRKRVRYISPKNVVEEIELMKEYIPRLDTIWIHDDSFTFKKDRVIEICKEIINRGIKLRFICSARFKPLDKEMIYWMERAGFVQMMFGLESGSQKVLDINNKRLKLEDALETVTLLKDSKMVVTCFLTIGLYKEDDKTIQETISFVNKLQSIKEIYYEDIGIAAIYPGTKLFYWQKEAGKIDDNFWLSNEDVPWFTLEHSREELCKYKDMVLDKIAQGRMGKQKI